jgi:hypothetical protein
MLASAGKKIKLPEKTKSATTAFFLALTLLILSKSASTIKNTKQAKKATTPIVTPNLQTLSLPLNGHSPSLYVFSEEIQPKTIIDKIYST